MVTLKAEARVPAGTEVVQRLRRTGFVPAVVYGKGLETQTITIPAKEMGKIIRDEGLAVVLTLELASGNQVVKIAELQREPVTRELLHLDFQVVAAS